MNMKLIGKYKLPKVINTMPELVSCGKAYANVNLQPSFKLNCWSFLVFNYDGRIQLQDEVFEHKPGDAFLTSPGVFKHHFPSSESFHIFAQMNFPGELPEKPAYCFFELEESYLHILSELNKMLIFQQLDKLRAQICLWNILQYLKESEVQGESREPEVLIKALEYIESNLQRASLGVVEIAGHCRVSTSYLLILFKRCRNKTIAAYLRERRLELAHSMLVNSTQAIKEIAFAVGIPDLHHFNKSVKRQFGLAPRKLRGNRN